MRRRRRTTMTPRHWDRLASLKYPDGRTITYDYGTAGSADDDINRLAAIEDGGQTLASYQYLGLNTIVTEDYQQPEVKLDYTGGGDSYSGLTKFNQVQDQIWSEYGARRKRSISSRTSTIKTATLALGPMFCIRPLMRLTATTASMN